MSSHGVARNSGSRTDEQKRQDSDRAKKFRDFEQELRDRISTNGYTYDPELFQLTTKLLRLHPEYYTIWNVRRRLLISGLLSKPSPGSCPSTALPSSSPSATTTRSSAGSSSSPSTETRPSHESLTAGKAGQNGSTAENDTHTHDDVNAIRSELVFTIPLLMDYPKSYWIWNYRRWVLEQAITRLDIATARRIWEEELALDSKMLNKDRRNYHAWGYRRYLVAQLESPQLGGKSMVESEFAYTRNMIRADLSNFSAWHNRSKLIPRLLNERRADDSARRDFLEEELGLVGDALNVGPEDQSLWFYHQFLISNLTEYVGRDTIAPNMSLEDRVNFMMREIENIKELLQDYADIKWIYEALMEYTMSLSLLEDRQPREDEKGDLRMWLGKLRELDPMRKGRWDDVEVECKL